MADYSFSLVLVYDNVGGVVRLARNQKVSVTDPATGATAAGLKVAGQPVSFVTSDAKGRATFTASIKTVRPVVGSTVLPDVTSPDVVAGTVTEIGYDTDGVPYIL
ncbi:MAG: hypothetical protein HOQ27_16505 [Dermatophilaceae bacterium]|nr:hypothetical protein [Dermatophilaceae bacterium]